MANRTILYAGTKIVSSLVAISAFLSLVSFYDTELGRPNFITATLYRWLARDRGDYYLLNWVEFLLLVGSTAFVVEGFLRRVHRTWQYTLEELLILTVAVALTISVMLSEGRLYDAAETAYQARMASLHRSFHFSWCFPWDRPPTYPLVNSIFCVPLAFGLFCAAYTSVWFGARGVARFYERLAKFFAKTA
jgi:uncharacterized membrane protein